MIYLQYENFLNLALSIQLHKIAMENIRYTYILILYGKYKMQYT